MERFTDHLGRTWNVELTPQIVYALERLTGIDATEFSNRFVKAASSSSAMLLNVFRTILADQLKARSMTESDFRQLVQKNADVLTTKLMLAIASNFPRQVRPQLKVAAMLSDRDRKLRRASHGVNDHGSI